MGSLLFVVFILALFVLSGVTACNKVTIIENDPTDYCELCTEKKSHTLCQFPKSNPKKPCKPQRLSVQDRFDLLQYHNDKRDRVAQGKEPPQPGASNMQRLRWDLELEKIARRWAEQCVDDHDTCRDSKRFKVGQNLAWYTYGDMEYLVNLWYDEVKLFKPEGVDSYRADSATGHYTQMVWAKTRLMGCALMDRGEATKLRFMLVCNYGPSGNFLNEPMYSKGDAATSCDTGTSRDEKYPGLCSDGSKDIPYSASPPARPTCSPFMVVVLLLLITDFWIFL